MSDLYDMDMSATALHIGTSAPGFAQNVRRMLQVKKAVHFQMNEKRGRIATSRLYRAGMPIVGTGDWNSRVFKRKTIKSDVLDTAILLLCDASGSMCGKKFVHASRACALMNHAFSNVLHIPTEILTFTSRGSRPEIGIIKSFGRKASNDDIALRFSANASRMAGNNDADSLVFGFDRILRRKEKRKVMIVLSDGSPADGVGDPVYALRQVVQEITDSRLVDLYGIGIMDHNVERFYPQHVVIDSAEDLERGLITLLGKALS